MRTNIPEADKILDIRFPVGDKGFVCLLDYFGTDLDVEAAARVSYADGTRKISDSRTLIRYLIRHNHSSPLEMCSLKFHLKMPLYVIQQLLRHRTACLSGDVELWFDEPAAVCDGDGRKSSRMTIKEFYHKWHIGTKPITKLSRMTRPDLSLIDVNKKYLVSEVASLFKKRPELVRTWITKLGMKYSSKNPYVLLGQDIVDFFTNFNYSSIQQIVPLQDRLRKQFLRSCDETTGQIVHTHVTDIWSNGEKNVFNVELENGYRIEMTEDHLCLTNQGWKTLKEATNLKFTKANNIVFYDSDLEFACNGQPLYRNKEWMAEQRKLGLGVQQIANLAGCSYHNIRKYLKLFDLKFTPAERAKIAGDKQRGQKRPFIKQTKGKKGQHTKEFRSGPNSNFWKGGVCKERSKIGAWTTQQAPEIHKRNGYKCVICSDGYKLKTHHIDPVFNNESRAYDKSNLTTLCKECHEKLHFSNLEILFLSAYDNLEDLTLFFTKNPTKIKAIKEKLKNRKPKKLIRTFSKVKSITYIGQKETFDISVDGPFHNFVANGFIVHNSLNMASYRYSEVPDEYETTQPDKWRLQSTDNKQGSDGHLNVRTFEQGEYGGEDFSSGESELHKRLTLEYHSRIRRGIAREQARKDIPVSSYSQLYWQMDLRNLLHFMSLRCDSHAQLEIREFANVIAGIVKVCYPILFEAWIDYSFCAKNFTRLDLEFLRWCQNNLSQTDIDYWAVDYMAICGTGIEKPHEKIGMGKRELNEFFEKIKSPQIPNFDLDLSKSKMTEQLDVE